MKAYRTLRDTLDLTPEQRAPLIAELAKVAGHSYRTLCDIPNVPPEERAPLLAEIATSAEYSRYTLRDTPNLTPEERAPLLDVVHTTPITQAQSALMRRVMDKINNDPTCWDQSSWHCGTSHCFAGHVEGEVYGEWVDDDLTRERAREVLGLSEDMADVLFKGRNTLELLNEYVDHLTIGAE